MQKLNMISCKNGYQMPPGRERPGSDEPGPEAEEILQDYPLRFRTMAENVSLGMFQIALGPNSRFISVNPVLASLLGYGSQNEISGRPTGHFFIHASDFSDLANDILRNGVVANREICLKQKDGSAVWVSVQAWKLGTTDPMLIEGFMRDITEYRVFEDEMQYHASELNRYAHALAQANKKLNLLSSITRHDLLNKLTGLSGMLELMKEDFLDPRVQEYCTLQSSIIQSIIAQVQFTKDYQDLGIENPRWFHVQEIVKSATASLTLSGIEVLIETDNLWIYADPMLEKVFYNLVENSLRHGETLGRISVTAEIGPDTARIIYADDGCGVPEEFKEDIFVRRHFKHTGFGLYLSREILGITDLSIHETGMPGRGARFEITIPRKNFRTGDAAT